MLLQTWLAPQASGDWHSSRSTNQRYKGIFTYDIESNKQADNGQALKKAHPSAGNKELNWCIKISPIYVLVWCLNARRCRIHNSQQHGLICFYFYQPLFDAKALKSKWVEVELEVATPFIRATWKPMERFHMTSRPQCWCPKNATVVMLVIPNETNSVGVNPSLCKNFLLFL